RAQAEADWLAGLWQVTGARIVESGESKVVRPHQDLILFASDMEIEIYMPDAEKHKPMSAVGAKVAFSGNVVKTGTQLLKLTSTDFSRGQKELRVVVKSANREKKTAEVKFLHRRDNDQAYEYQLEISKIDDTKRRQEIAQIMKPFLDGTADPSVFGESGVAGPYRRGATDAPIRDAIVEWAKSVAIN
ncbi:MAG: hypothetical protein ABI557_03360, partial [Aureliella sp.]